SLISGAVACVTIPPVALDSLGDELHAGIERDHPVGTGADGRLLEAIVADPLDVLAGNDPSHARRRRAVVRQEIGPRVMEEEAHPPGVDDLNVPDLLLEDLAPPPPLPVHAELDVLA